MQQSQFATGRAGGLAQCYSRIMREYREISSEKNAFWTASPVDFEEPSEWHFTVKGPTESEFEGGVYHGRVVLPQNYPFSPPHVMLLTPNGRFEVGKKICLSASNYHPELWQPAWGIRSLLDALHAFFPTPGEGALHSLDWPADVRRKLAKESVNYACGVCRKSNRDIVEEGCAQAKRNDATSDTSAALVAPPSAARVAPTAPLTDSNTSQPNTCADDPSPTTSTATTRASAANGSLDNLTVGIADVDTPTSITPSAKPQHQPSTAAPPPTALPTAALPTATASPAAQSGPWATVINYVLARDSKDVILWAADFLMLIIVLSCVASFVDLVLKPPTLIKDTAG